MLAQYTAMTYILIILAILVSALFATLTYSLREYSRGKLSDLFELRHKQHLFSRIDDNASDLAFITAAIRMVCNLVVLIGVLHIVRDYLRSDIWEYSLGVGITATLALIFSVALPHAISSLLAEKVISFFTPFLLGLLIICRPLLALLSMAESLVKKATHTGIVTEAAEKEKAENDLDSEILAAVEEGEKEGVVDTSEREMIESVIQFRDTTVSQVMTARPDIASLPINASLDKVRAHIEETGHSRIPIHENSLDHIVGVLYARDLLKFVGEAAPVFNLQTAMRHAFFVPETKPLRDLLQDFRLQKVHIAIVLDEYGGTAGLVTIEDVLEELVGEISDEHEPIEPATFKRIDDNTAEVDAKIHIDELNRLLGTHLPEDAAYDTLGGFVSTHLGRIPQTGTQFEHDNGIYTILDAEPQRVNRIKIHLLPTPHAETKQA